MAQKIIVLKMQMLLAMISMSAIHAVLSLTKKIIRVQS